jgi:hypothetical protein
MWAGNLILQSIIQDLSQREIITKKESEPLKAGREEKEDGCVFQAQGDAEC